MVVPIQHVIIIAGMLFTIGVVGVLFRRNAIIVFMSVELMLNAVNLAFVGFSRYHGTADGQVFAFFIMALAGAEVSVGLAIIIAVYRNLRTTDLSDIGQLKY